MGLPIARQNGTGSGWRGQARKETSTYGFTISTKNRRSLTSRAPPRAEARSKSRALICTPCSTPRAMGCGCAVRSSWPRHSHLQGLPTLLSTDDRWWKRLWWTRPGHEFRPAAGRPGPSPAARGRLPSRVAPGVGASFTPPSSVFLCGVAAHWRPDSGFTWLIRLPRQFEPVRLPELAGHGHRHRARGRLRRPVCATRGRTGRHARPFNMRWTTRNTGPGGASCRSSPTSWARGQPRPTLGLLVAQRRCLGPAGVAAAPGHARRRRRGAAIWAVCRVEPGRAHSAAGGAQRICRPCCWSPPRSSASNAAAKTGRRGLLLAAAGLVARDRRPWRREEARSDRWRRGRAAGPGVGPGPDRHACAAAALAVLPAAPDAVVGPRVHRRAIWPGQELSAGPGWRSCANFMNGGAALLAGAVPLAVCLRAPCRAGPGLAVRRCPAVRGGRRLRLGVRRPAVRAAVAGCWRRRWGGAWAAATTRWPAGACP